MTPEEKRLAILAGTRSTNRKIDKLPKGESYDVLGIVFIIVLLMIILFAAIAGGAF